MYISKEKKYLRYPHFPCSWFSLSIEQERNCEFHIFNVDVFRIVDPATNCGTVHHENDRARMMWPWKYSVSWGMPRTSCVLFFWNEFCFFFLYIGLFSGNLSSVRSKIIITLHLSVIESNSQANNRHKIWKMLMQIGIFYLWSSVANSVTVWCRTRKPPVWFKTLNSPMPVKTVVLTIFVPNARHDFYGYFLLHGMS